jgi:hypothetical protein
VILYLNLPLLAASFIVLAANTDHQLVARWPDGTELRVCAQVARRGGLDPCEEARHGRWQPLGYPPLGLAATTCVPRPGCRDER